MQEAVGTVSAGVGYAKRERKAGERILGPTDICRVWSSGGQDIVKGGWARVCRLTDHPRRKNFEERMVPRVKCYRRVREDGD